MDAKLKNTLKAVTLELRHLLEGRYDGDGRWKPGDLEQRLAAIGVRRDRESVPVDELRHLAAEDRQARRVVDAYLKLREEAGVDRSDAVAEFVRETAYTWANRLLALRCMEARELIDSVILQQEAYGGRSLEHHRLAQRHPELCAGDDDGLFAVLDKVFREQSERLPMLFDPQAPGIALRPAPAALKDCFGLLSLSPDTLRRYRVRVKEDEAANAGDEPPNPFTAPDALGWAYQYWNTEEKDRVFERVRTVKGAKIAGADIVPATQLYTEDYMVKFLVQNSLGATWMGMHPESRLSEGWAYYVRDADRSPVKAKPVGEITFLDPACGSGHFLLEAFDLFYAMYEEEGRLTDSEQICTAILTKNLSGIDIDARSVQISEAVLWMKAAENVFDFKGGATNLVAATASHLNGEAWEQFLASFQREPSVARVLRKFAQSMEHIDEIGSLARPAEELKEIIREEHATWEQQVRERRETNYLFPEMNRAVLQEHLPFHEISDGEFGERLFYRAKAGIDTFTQRARESGEFEDQMLGDETRAGFRLVDLLSRRYDVVAANPPYMGEGNMPPVLKTFISDYYKAGKQDLYAAFILSCNRLTQSSGHVAFVTPQSWMFQSTSSKLRLSDKEGTEGLLQLSSFEVIAQLGRHAFSESDPPANVVLVTTCRRPPSQSHTIVCYRLSTSRPSAEQAALLYSCVRGNISSATSRPNQYALTQIPHAPFCYWLTSGFLRVLTTYPGLTQNGDLSADVRMGSSTKEDVRFLRLFWETKNPDRWVKFTKGGRYQKWYGLETHRIDWQHHGVRPKTRVVEKYRYLNGNYGWVIKHEDRHFEQGLTYSLMARGAFGVRMMTDAISGHASHAIFAPKSHSLEELAARLSNRCTSFLLRVITQDIKFESGYVARLPVVASSEFFRRMGELCVALKFFVVQSDLTEEAFSSHALPRMPEDTINMFGTCAVLHMSEAAIDHEVARCYGLGIDDENLLNEEVGPLAGSLPLLREHSKLPSLQNVTNTITEYVDAFCERCGYLDIDVNQLALMRERVRVLFEAGRGAEPDTDTDIDPAEERADSDDALGSLLPLPAETFLEELSQKVGVNTVSVYWLLKEGIEKVGWRCLPEERRLWADRVTVSVLRLLGHRWPNQIETGEPVPDWADHGGIIPLTPLVHKSTLFEQVQERLHGDKIDTNDLTQVVGKPLDIWLATEFFKRHTQQFKKRPIAWQLQSRSFSTRTSPAFACMVFYHRLDVDLLPKLRSQYVGPLRQRLETEQRGILTIAAEARSDRQVKRLAELEDAIAELKKFDATLDAVSGSGFGPPFLHGHLRQYAFDDAMLALKARWLRRLSELVAGSSLPDWLDKADETGLHPDLRTWIADAMAHLDHFCAKVGPKPPDQSKVVADPAAEDLAKLIAPQAPSMLKDALGLACDTWWERFEEIVQRPDKEQVKALKQEQKDCEAELEADSAPSSAEVRRLKYRVKEIKEEIKVLNASIKKRTERAGKLRSRIEAWESQEPQTWGDWLAGQPLFDRISSLDGRRIAPTTVAEFVAQESLYAPDINDGVRINIAPLQKAGILAADVLAPKDLDKAIADRAEWRADERRWVREGKLPQPGWWPEKGG